MANNDSKSNYYDANKHASLNADFIDHNEIELSHNDLLSAENKLIKLETYQLLSTESKEVIDMIINTPAEVLGFITTPKGTKSKKLIIKYLQKKWKSKFIVEKIIDEITRLVKSF